MPKLIVLFSLFSLLFCANLRSDDKVFHYYSTVSDELHYPLLLNLIGSIHKVDFDALDQIAVFNIGMSQDQINFLNQIEKVKVYNTELRHPDMLKHFVTDTYGRSIRGWFLWKPVVMKQSLDLFPYCLYMDSGTTLISSPDNLFKHIKQNGYFLLVIPPHNIDDRITRSVLDKVIAKLPTDQQELVLRKNTYMIDAGLQGISRDVFKTYINPIYQLTTDISLFADDGTSKMGFGSGRHDQTICSIYACLAQMTLNSQGWSLLKVDGKPVPFHMHWSPSEVNAKTCIYRSRGDTGFGGDKIPYIRKIQG